MGILAMKWNEEEMLNDLGQLLHPGENLLAGVYCTAIKRGYKKVYGMVHGIQGLLEERVVDLSEHIEDELDVELLKRTPSAYLGS